MNKNDVVKHFGSVRSTAEAFRLSTQAVYAWPDLVPEAVALKAEKLSSGKLKYDAKDYALD